MVMLHVGKKNLDYQRFQYSVLCRNFSCFFYTGNSELTLKFPKTNVQTQVELLSRQSRKIPSEVTFLT